MEEATFGTVANIFSLQRLSRDEVSQALFAGTLIFSIGFCLLYSWIPGFLVISAFLSGILICILFRERIIYLSSLLKTSIPETPSVAGQKVRQPCHVCGNRKCGRHKIMVPSYHQTFLPEPVDHALQQLFEQILEMYITRWHSKILKDFEFEQQLRLSIQGAVSSLLYRAKQLDESQVIMERLLPAVMSHLDLLLRHKKSHQSSQTMGQQMSQQVPERWPLGDDHSYKSLPIQWHPATLSRRHELSYLRHLTMHILPHIIPEHQLKCRAWGGLVREILARWVLLPAMDLLADSTIVLRLLAHLLESSSSPQADLGSSIEVPTLRRFVSSSSGLSTSRLRMGLSDVIHDPQLLYYFMQFLKKEGSVHVLQFCLDLEKFNDKILQPELKDSECEELYQEAWDIFSLYFQYSSPDFVGFPADIVRSMSSVLEAGEKNILSLRNTPPLFQAFDWAFTKLERELLPLFHHSEDFFLMLCGKRQSKLNRRRPRREKNAEELLDMGWRRQDGSANRDMVMSPEDNGPDTSSYRNLSAWRVSVPRVYLRPDMPGSSRITAVMVISVQRIDIGLQEDPAEGFWTIYRSHSDFCALASKLQEFHGEFEQAFGAPLKRPQMTRGQEALENWRIEGEEYLQLLLQTPALQNSDLLAAFLSSDITDFAEVIGGTELSLGRLLSTVRLRKENGQHLEPFVGNLLTASRRSARKKKKRPKKESNDITTAKNITKLKKLNLSHTIYEDNLGHSSKLPANILDCVQHENLSCQPLQGIYDILAYLVVRLFESPSYIAHVAFTVRKVASTFINSYVQRALHFKLRNCLWSPRLVQLINMLTEAISGNRPTSRLLYAEQEETYAKTVLRLAQSLIPWPLSSMPNTGGSIVALIAAIRTPILNKQLAYTLLDIVAEELVPELKSNQSDNIPNEI